MKYWRLTSRFLTAWRDVCLARWLLLALFVIIFLSSCGGGDSVDPEVAALQTQVAAQQTAAAQPPTEVPAATEGGEGPTAAAAEAPDAATAEQVEPAEEAPPDVPATETAQALSTIAAGEAEAAAAQEAERAATLEPIRAEVASYGVDPSQGNLGFVHPPISIEENDFEDVDWKNQNLLTVARDFVLAADVTWNSQYAESGCGFAVRSDGDEEDPSQYLIGMTRGAQGHVLFAEQVVGEVDLNQVTDIYANGIDPQFEWQNDTTNRIAIVGQGQQFTIYSNGTRLGTITGQAGFEEGFVAFFALNRSGGIRCDFNNAWLWRIN